MSALEEKKWLVRVVNHHVLDKLPKINLYLEFLLASALDNGIPIYELQYDRTEQGYVSLHLKDTLGPKTTHNFKELCSYYTGASYTVYNEYSNLHYVTYEEYFSSIVEETTFTLQYEKIEEALHNNKLIKLCRENGFTEPYQLQNYIDKDTIAWSDVRLDKLFELYQRNEPMNAIYERHKKNIEHFKADKSKLNQFDFKQFDNYIIS